MRLVFDTSSKNVSIGLFENGQYVLGKDHAEETHQQSKLLMKMILEILKSKSLTPVDITEVAVGIGPGSYTGLRVGLTVAKIWAFSKGIPLYAFSSKELLDRTQEAEKRATAPKVQYLQKSDFVKVTNINELTPHYENDKFA